MSKKMQVTIMAIAVLFTAFFVWSALTTTNSGTSDNNSQSGKNTPQNNADASSGQKTSGGATIVNGNGDNDAQPAPSNENSGKVTNSSPDKNSNKETNSGAEKDSNTVSGDTSNGDSNEEYTIYEVKKGDTLLSICKQYTETSPLSIISKAILTSNKLSNSSEIKTGMKLNIPVKYSNGSKYTVANGDSLYTIASSYMPDIDVYKAIETIMKDNFLTTDKIKVGEELFIAKLPVTDDSESTATNSQIGSAGDTDNGTNTDTNAGVSDNTSTASDTSKESYISYTVKKGDTLQTISKKYEKNCPLSVASKTILKVNQLTSSAEVKEGIELKIPEKYFTSGEIYTVKYGDSLSQIALSLMQNLDMSKAVEKIMKDNFLTTDNIRFGQEIFVASIDSGL